MREQFPLAEPAIVSGLALTHAVSGKAIYTARCQSCHGADGAGNVALAKMLDARMRPLGSAWVKLGSDASLKK